MFQFTQKNMSYLKQIQNRLVKEIEWGASSMVELMLPKNSMTSPAVQISEGVRFQWKECSIIQAMIGLTAVCNPMCDLEQLLSADLNFGASLGLKTEEDHRNIELMPMYN